MRTIIFLPVIIVDNFHHMKSILFLALLVLQLGFTEHSVCLESDPASLVKLTELPLKTNSAYQFKISHHPASVTILRRQDGTFFMGNFSTLTLMGDRSSHKYISTGFSFKYPPQHRVANLSNEVIEMQIMYQLDQQSSKVWKHKSIALSISFVMTEYAPTEQFTLGKQINQELTNGSVIDIGKLLPLIPGFQMVLYKGIHSEFPDDQAFLWLVRQELLLMSQDQLQTVKDCIFSHVSKQKIGYHGLLKRLSDLNEISQIVVSSESQQNFS